ncbi:MAG: hypothetical protein PHT30_02330 [Bacilli bacterium]|nr:hypothetical protein [Bacilli bacterium]
MAIDKKDLKPFAEREAEAYMKGYYHGLKLEKVGVGTHVDFIKKSESMKLRAAFFDGAKAGSYKNFVKHSK